jgi:autotransporter adhesin
MGYRGALWGLTLACTTASTVAGAWSGPPAGAASHRTSAPVATSVGEVGTGNEAFVIAFVGTLKSIGIDVLRDSATGDSLDARFRGAATREPGLNSFALGPYAEATGEGSTAVGYHSLASGKNSTAFGNFSLALADNSIAFGVLSAAMGVNSLAFGNLSLASGEGSAAIGVQSQSSGLNSLAIGSHSLASGESSTAIGVLSEAIGANSLAIGNHSVASGENSTAFGLLSTADGLNSTAVGNQSHAKGDNSVAIGILAHAKAENTTAVGNQSKASGANSTAVGILALADGENSTAVGNQSKAMGANSTSVGVLSRATGDDSLAVGNQSRATAVGAVAIGTVSRATGEQSVALGTGAVASGANAIAIGAGSIADIANTVSFGSVGHERRITNIADGVDATDAATVGQLDRVESRLRKQVKRLNTKLREANRSDNSAADRPQVSRISAAPATQEAKRARPSKPKTEARTTQAVGAEDRATPVERSPERPRGDGGASPASAVAGRLASFENEVQSRLVQIDKRIDNNANGVAMAMALTGSSLPAGKKFAVAVNYGTFAGTSAIALSSHLRVSENAVVSGGLSYGVDQNLFGGRAGVQFAW